MSRDLFIKKMEELFMWDRADLDFGLYRIMNSRRDEIRAFLESDLVGAVQVMIGGMGQEERSGLLQERDAKVHQYRDDGFTEEQILNAKSIREIDTKLATIPDAESIANEIFSHLVQFFGRYYQEGDFIPQRRYRRGNDAYAMPYNGEEVVLHWANRDQYYVKSGEYFRDYRFVLPDGRVVHFKLVEADTERNNNKAQRDQERRFQLLNEGEWRIEDNILEVPFVYRPDAQKRSQIAINTETTAWLDENLPPEWRDSLRHPAKQGSLRSLLESRLADYTARNTFDYFIHKDLGGFLRRELDFYIKNEVLRLDDFADSSEVAATTRLLTIKAMRYLGQQIITLLAQMEEFEKRLWLKKKFVVETYYCVTLDLVPAALYSSILANEAQQAEWVRLFAIDEIKAEMGVQTVGYTVPLSDQFLRENPFLLLNTRLFDQAFVDALLGSFDNIDDATDGLLVHSENFQALNLMQERYKAQVQCVYIDPPYNTNASEIIYHNGYKHSSWLSLMADKLYQTVPLIMEGGFFCVTIDDAEYHRLYSLLLEIFGEDGILGTVPIRSNPAGRSTLKGFAVAHEYAVFATADADASIGRLQRSEKQIARYKERDNRSVFEWVNFRKHGGYNANRIARQKLFYPIYANQMDGSIRIPSMEWDETTRVWNALEEPTQDEVVVYPITPNGSEKTWKWGNETAQNSITDFVARPDVTGKTGVYMKSRMKPGGTLPTTWWDKKEYSATEYGTNLLGRILGSTTAFSFPKAVHATEDCLRVADVESDDIVLDYFGGSGTTAHAVINLNREDGGKRKYILVEMGEYFDTVLLPRVQKVVYSDSWKDGKPVSRQGSSQLIKIVRLESYEDALNNIDVPDRRNDTAQRLLDDHTDVKNPYLLRYMLDTESRDSPTLLDIEALEDPFAYTLKVSNGSVGATVDTIVDLPETFNYLLGVRVATIRTGKGWRLVRGVLPDGRGVLILWRRHADLPNEQLEAFFRAEIEEQLDGITVLYVNGDNTLGALRSAGARWQLRLIEPDFYARMNGEA